MFELRGEELRKAHRNGDGVLVVATNGDQVAKWREFLTFRLQGRVKDDVADAVPFRRPLSQLADVST